MTANDVRSLPPELMRKGRVDEIWFMALPTKKERFAIWEVQFKAYGRLALWQNLSDTDRATLVQATRGFTGSEIEGVVVNAMYEAFAAGHDVTMPDLLTGAAGTVPIMKTMPEKLNDVLQWGKEGRAKAASDPDPEEDVITGDDAGRFLNLAPAVSGLGEIPSGEN